MADETPTNAQDDDSKKETIRITLPPKTEPSGITPPPPSPAAPPVPPPPTSSAGAPPPPPPTRPLSGAVPPPKPPPLAGKPTVPLRPATPAGSGVQGSGIAPRPTSPKKETARINLPSGANPAPALPKATVKMQQTQPLSKAPAPALSQSVSLQQAAASAAASAGAGKPDKVALGLSIAAFVVAGVALFIVNSISTAAKLPSWAP